MPFLKLHKRPANAGLLFLKNIHLGDANRLAKILNSSDHYLVIKSLSFINVHRTRESL